MLGPLNERYRYSTNFNLAFKKINKITDKKYLTFVFAAQFKNDIKKIIPVLLYLPSNARRTSGKSIRAVCKN
jgi:hypothetical protein